VTQPCRGYQARWDHTAMVWCGGGREQDSVERQTEHPGSVYQLTWVLVIESWKLS
jgi:hypothetical protein